MAPVTGLSCPPQRRAPAPHPAPRRGDAPRVPRPPRAASAELASNVVAAPPTVAAVSRPKVSQAVMTGAAPGRLTAGATSFVEEHRVRGYEAGPDQRASITTIGNLLQEVASNHGVSLWGRTEFGFATDPIMAERNLIFAMTRLQIQMDRYPKWGDMVKVETWFQEEGRVAACRNWVVTNALDGSRLGHATSTWVMVNTVTRRLAKMPDEMRVKMDLLSPNPRRETVPPEHARQRLPDLDEAAAVAGPRQVARRSDMDMNGHINNVTYLAWTLETVPEAVFEGRQLTSVEVDFKSECVAGQSVESLAHDCAPPLGAAPGQDAFVHLLRRCDDEGCYDLVSARTVWGPVKH